MWKRIALYCAIAITALGGAVLTYLYSRRPAQVPPSAIRVASTPERVARGKYLFEVLCNCGHCHSLRDFTRFSGPEVESGRGQGNVFPVEFGLPGQVIAPNITPDPETGIGRWSDGEKIRAIRDGIDREGRALFPMMPYTFYRHMSDEDVESVVAYLNQMKPVRNPLPRSRIDFPVNLLIRSAPQPAGRVSPPDQGDRVKYGEYLVRLGGCMDCHTPIENGRPASDKLLGGGREMRLPYGLVVSANITPDDSGIGPWGERQFLNKFAEYRDYATNGPPKVGAASFTLMPWLSFSQLPEEDLAAIFAFLKTQKPVKNHVEVHPGVPKPEAGTGAPGA
jgi:mono/diheme cytochrome c family protein